MEKNMNKLPISVCIIAKNEEKYLEGCLQKLIPYGFEIIVTDTGSTDKTMEIAKKYTNKVYEFPWINDFSAARNFSASKASNQWILALDCDEYLESIDIDKLLNMLPSHRKEVGIISLENLIKNGNSIGKSNQKVNRLYNKKYSKFEGLIHEQIRSTTGNNIPAFDVPIFIKHYGYMLTEKELDKKNERNISLLLKEIENNPNEPYYYFQIGQSYAMVDDYEKVYHYLQKGISLDPNPNDAYVPQMLINYGTSMLNTGRYKMAMNMELLYDSLSEYSDYFFLLGRIYFANNLPLKAIQTFVKATVAPKCIVFGTNSFFPLHSMALIYEQIGEKEMAETCNKKVEELVTALSNDKGFQL